MLGTSNEDGICYINTVSMDGEKNLKKRLTPKDLDQLITSDKDGLPAIDELTFTAICKAEKPHPSLEKFEGSLRLGKGYFTGLSIEQLLMNGTSLKNTRWVLGFCVYTGVDTKLMLNAEKG